MFPRKLALLILVVLVLSGLFLLSACSQGNPSKRRAGEPPVLEGFVGTTAGLDISLMQGAPPSVIYDEGNSPFSFIITLENVGEADVGPGTDNPLVFARLSGIMYKNFGLTEKEAVKTLDSELTGARRNFDGSITQGEIGYLGFDDLAYQPNVFESFALTMRGEVCYDYESNAMVKFCMKRDVWETLEDASICTLKGPKPVGNSGAPIHITGVEEAGVNNKTIQLNLVIEHVGNGIYFYRDDYSSLSEVCSFDDTNPNIYKLEVFVEPVEEDAYEVECVRLEESLPGGGAYGTIRMYRGAPLTISCFIKRVKPVSVRVYEDLLNIRLRYRYGDFIEVPVIIQGHP